jgi:hypothetical protein
MHWGTPPGQCPELRSLPLTPERILDGTALQIEWSNCGMKNFALTWDEISKLKFMPSLRPGILKPSSPEPEPFSRRKARDRHVNVRNLPSTLPNRKREGRTQESASTSVLANSCEYDHSLRVGCLASALHHWIEYGIVGMEEGNTFDSITVR